ncbi:hypothetical protein [Lacinutrix sp.]|uniref:hypothetical protein n=1 Tax=Lacinutrix sp. TaxID=1937692 RepID=UPI0025B9DA2A|nr:hypothetical protein [Lacinutrix sp.]
MKYILSILSLLFFFSCKTEENKIGEYQIFTMKSGPENSRTIDSMKYRVFVEKNKRIYEYKSLENDSTYFFRFEKNINNDSILTRFYDIDCELIDKVDFQFKNKKVSVFKYAYDLEDMADEEEDYYFTEEYGLIMLQNIAWLRFNVLINEEELKPLQDSIINNHYKFKSSIPPPIKIESKN